MAYRSQKAACLAALTILALALPLGAQSELKYEVRHDHWRKYGKGTLVIDNHGISYREISKSKKKAQDTHHGEWAYEDIQQLFISSQRIVLVTYEDRKWLLGADREWEFTIEGETSFEQAYRILKERLDQRFVAAFPDSPGSVLWELPVKLQGLIRGSHGVLQVAHDRIVFRTDRPEASRTWRYRDIENISSSGPFQITLTSYERARAHYGSRKNFNFQLKRPLDERLFNELWRRLNQAKGLELLDSIYQGDKSP